MWVLRSGLLGWWQGEARSWSSFGIGHRVLGRNSEENERSKHADKQGHKRPYIGVPVLLPGKVSGPRETHCDVHAKKGQGGKCAHWGGILRSVASTLWYMKLRTADEPVNGI